MNGYRDFWSDVIFSPMNIPARVYRFICYTVEDAMHLYLEGHLDVKMILDCQFLVYLEWHLKLFLRLSLPEF